MDSDMLITGILVYYDVYVEYTKLECIYTQAVYHWQMYMFMTFFVYTEYNSCKWQIFQVLFSICEIFRIYLRFQVFVALITSPYIRTIYLVRVGARVPDGKNYLHNSTCQ
jgi:hypothetical protein